MKLTDRYLLLATPAGRAFALENPMADCKLGTAAVIWSGSDRDEWRHRAANLNAIDVPGPLGKLAAAAVVRYGIIDSHDGRTSSAFAVPAGDTTAWSANAWTLGHVTTFLIDHRAEAAARGVRPAA